MENTEIKNFSFAMDIPMPNVPSDEPIIAKNKDYVKYGKDNAYSKYLQELKKFSTIHNRIITYKIKSIIGNGLTYDKRKDKKTDEFFDHPNGYETLDELAVKLTTDLVEQGGFFLEVIYKPDSTIKEIHHIPFEKIALGKVNERGIIEKFYYSDDWDKYSPTITSMNRFTDKQSGILYFKSYRSTSPYYPEPSYISAIPHINMEMGITNFHLANINYGMELGTTVTFVNGEPSEEIMRDLINKWNNRHGGPGKAAKPVYMFVNSKDEAPIIQTPNASQLDKKFLQLQDTVKTNILVSHGVNSPILLGLETSTGFSNGNEMIIAYKQFDYNELQPLRKNVEDVLNSLGKLNGLQLMFFDTNTPIDFTWSEDTLKGIMTIDEMRHKIQLEPIEQIQQAEQEAQDTQTQIGFIKPKPAE